MKNSRRIAILIHPDVSLSSAMLIKDIFERTNLYLDKRFQVSYVVLQKFTSNELPFTWRPANKSNTFDLLIIPPANHDCTDLKKSLSNLSLEIKYIKDAYRKGVSIASVCLGGFLLAEAGILDHKKATTHWAFNDFAKKNYPEVRWQTQKILESEKGIITGGGYLTMVDLVFYILDKIVGKKIAADMAKRLLVDSVRQSQAIYAIQNSGKHATSFQEKMHQWFEKNFKKTITLKIIAKDMGMGERTLHRSFFKEFSMTPNQWIQCQRIEKAKKLLENGNLSQDEIIDEIGLKDINSFRKIFVRELGVTPAEYRRKLNRRN